MTYCETLRRYVDGELQPTTVEFMVMACLAFEVDELNRSRQTWFEAIGDFRSAVAGLDQLSEAARSELRSSAFILGTAADFAAGIRLAAECRETTEQYRHETSRKTEPR
jgi:hypothetical protein